VSAIFLDNRCSWLARDVGLAEAVNGSRIASRARTNWRLPTALLIRPVSAIGKRYVMTAGMRFQYQTIAVEMNDAA
jgi:hypothetical protein